MAAAESENANPRRGLYACPRCNGVLRLRKRSEAFYPLTLPIVGTGLGAFRGYICERCGKIPFSELPSDAKVIKVLMCVATVFLLFVVGVGIVASMALP